MKIKIKRIDKELPLPQYQTPGAVAFDLCSRIDAEIGPQEIKPVPSNVIIEVPEGYVFMTTPRSSLCKKKGLIFPNSIGIFDQDFCGPGDEVMIILYNINKEPCQIKRGERLAQGLLVKIDKVEWDEVDEMDKPTRGGIGSTQGYSKV
ncbi:dUTP diphosphatase [Patescibacteria group bacterium]|nr:dUTP diphosphatase [Patescibacteria group bacterium]MBU1921902.1 dUTP diphosphatase [Patescibacteria group bacterium]